MEKSKQVERIATKIQETFQMWETIGGTPQNRNMKSNNPKMYHSIDDSISIPLFVDGKKIVVVNIESLVIPIFFRTLVL